MFFLLLLAIRPTGFVAGTSHLTLADISATSLVFSVREIGLVPFSAYPELPAWLERVKDAVPNFDKTCMEGVVAMGHVFKQKLAEIEGK